MKFTIDLINRIITIHGSFTYQQYTEFHQTLPKEWSAGFVIMIPADMAVSLAAGEPKQIEQNQYPLVFANEDFYGCGRDNCGAASCGCNN